MVKEVNCKRGRIERMESVGGALETGNLVVVLHLAEASKHVKQHCRHLLNQKVMYSVTTIGSKMALQAGRGAAQAEWSGPVA